MDGDKVKFEIEELSLLFVMVAKCQGDYQKMKDYFLKHPEQITKELEQDLSTLNFSLKTIPSIQHKLTLLLNQNQFKKPDWNEPEN